MPGLLQLKTEVQGCSLGSNGGLKEPEADKKGSLAEVVRVLASEVGQIRGILDVGLAEMVEAMSWWMEDH